MLAQSTTTGQANETTPIAAKKAKRAALATIQPGETPVQAAIRAAHHQRWTVTEAASKANTAAEEAARDAKAALNAVIFPAELVVQAKPKITDDPLTWAIALVSRHPVDGREVRKEIDTSKTERLDSREAIIAHFGDDHPDLGPRIATLESWLAETAHLREASERAEKAEEKADLAFQRSYNKTDALCRAILQAEASPDEALTQVEAYARLLSSCNGKNVKPSQITFEEDAAVAIEFMHRVLKGLSAGPSAPTFGRVAWDAAVAEYEAAHRAYHEVAAKELQPLLDTHDRIDPAFRAPCLHQGFSIRWHGPEALQKDILFTPEAKALLAAGAVEACAIRQSYFSSDRDTVEDARTEVLAEAMWQAEKRLTDMTPPDVVGAAYKVAVQARESDDDKFGFNDLGLVSYLLHTYRGSGDIVRTYLDLLQIAGIDHPALRMEPFDPAAWIAAYEALGGKVSDPQGNLVITYAADDEPGSAALRSELAATPWKYRAVYLEAQRRKGEGGDPFVDSYGGAGKDDGRGYSTKFYGHIERADHILFSTDAETRLPVPHLEHIDNRFSPWLPAAFGVRADVERSLIAAE